MDQYIDQDREMEIKKQQMAAAAYFFKKTDQYIAFEKNKNKSILKANSLKLSYNFHKVISLSIPSLPPCLQKPVSSNPIENKPRKESDQIHILVQLLSCPDASSCVSIDNVNNCINLTNPTPSRKFSASNAPKLFAVDTVINEDCPIMEICSNSLGAVIRSVANGEDACVISFGNVPSTDLNAIIGSDRSPTTIGVMPCAILWLFNYIKTIRKHEYARSSVRISAAEISGKQENCRDLLLSISNPANDNQSFPSSSPSLFNSLVELRAVNVEKAAYYLDYALTERSKSEENGLSHMFLTLHLYQYHLQNDSGISGGRSRLHIIDLGCGRSSEDTESTALSIQGISKVIYAIWSHQKYIPNSDSILAQTLKRIIVNSYGMMQTSMIIKISGKETQYNETLQVIQLASKLYRQKVRSSKLSTSICSDDNSSLSDSFSIRRMTKFRHKFGPESRLLDCSTITLSASSDFDATSSSEVSCDTVIYRGHPSNSSPSNIRSGCACNYQGQATHLENDGKKSEQKLTLFQMKRRTSNKTNSNAWPKVAVKKAKEVMKSGQELWVDGPEAFCSANINNNNNNNNTETEINDQPKITTGLENEKVDDFHPNSQIISSKSNKGIQNFDTTINRNDYYVKPKHSGEKISNENVLKSKMVTDWLRNQPELQENKEPSNPSPLQTYGKLGQSDRDKGEILGCTIPKASKSQKIQADQIDPKITGINFSRIEDWIRTVSIESPKRTASTVSCEVIMTQSLFSPNCSPYHTTESRFNSFANVPLSPPSAPINYSSNFCEQNTNSSRGVSVPPGSASSEIENECSRLWFYNPIINERHLMPFVDTIEDTNNNKFSSYLGTSFANNNQTDSLRSLSFQNQSKNINCQMSVPQYDQTVVLGLNNVVNYGIPKYSTLPLDSHSPKHGNLKLNQKNRNNDQCDGGKQIETFSFTQTTENSTKTSTDIKRTQKETKKKEYKKGFGFLNHLIRNKKLKKDLTLNRSSKDEVVTTNVPTSQVEIQSNECHLPLDSIDYAKKAGPPLLLSSPYHMVTQPKTSIARTESSGHGSDCSSIKEVKATQVPVNFHQGLSGYRCQTYRRAGSSGYESVVRDSELSSHNDSASDCSTTTNLVLQSKNIIHTNNVISSVTTTSISTNIVSQSTSKSSVNVEQFKNVDSTNYMKESQKVNELIKSENLCMLEMEQEDIKNELLCVLKFFNDDIDGSRKYLESHLSELEGGDYLKSADIINSTNQTLRSVLSRYQSNLTMVTSFVGKPHSDFLYD